MRASSARRRSCRSAISIVARLPIDTVRIWDYGSAGSFKNLAALGLISFVLFSSFISVGLVVATILGRAEGPVGGLYFGDLLGAGLGCLVAIPIISSFGPPAVVFLAAVLLGRRGDRVPPASPVVDCGRRRCADGRARRRRDRARRAARRAARTGQARPDPRGLLGVGSGLPRRRAQRSPTRTTCSRTTASFGSGIWAYNDDPASLTRFNIDPRRLPFNLLGTPPKHTLIVGSAGGNEILAALHFHSPRIEGVELNPVTVSLLRHKFADYTGHLDKQPGVSIHQADARSFIAAQQRQVPARVDRRARQLRGEQRRVIGGVRALGELPLHGRDDQAEPAAPQRRRHHGGPVRRARLHEPAEPHRPLRRDRAGPR